MTRSAFTGQQGVCCARRAVRDDVSLQLACCALPLATHAQCTWPRRREREWAKIGHKNAHSVNLRESCCGPAGQQTEVMAVCGAPSHPAVARAAGRQGAAAAAAHAPVRPCLGPQRAQAARRHATVLAGRSVTVEVEPSQGASGGAATGVTRPKRAPRAKAPTTRVDHGLGNVRPLSWLPLRYRLRGC